MTGQTDTIAARTRRILRRVLFACAVFHFLMVITALGALAWGALDLPAGLRVVAIFLLLGVLSLRGRAMISRVSAETP